MCFKHFRGQVEMIYIGLGNGGTRMLWDLYLFAQGLPTGKGEGLKVLDHYVFGDADSNNSVIYEIRRHGLEKLQPPQGGVKLLSLDQFWRGGCGVYHIIGELIAEKANELGLVD